MRKLSLIITVLLAFGTSQVSARSEAENTIIALLQRIYDQGPGGSNSGSAQNVSVSAAPGAAHEANSQVATSTTAATLIIAHPTRRSCLIRNMDATISVYFGAATVTSANGMLLKAGESVVVTSVTLLQVIAASGTPTVAVFDEYD